MAACKGNNSAAAHRGFRKDLMITILKVKIKSLILVVETTELRLGVTQGHLLFEGHPRKGIFYTHFDRLCIIEVNRGSGYGYSREP